MKLSIIIIIVLGILSLIYFNIQKKELPSKNDTKLFENIINNSEYYKTARKKAKSGDLNYFRTYIRTTHNKLLDAQSYLDTLIEKLKSEGFEIIHNYEGSNMTFFGYRGIVFKKRGRNYSITFMYFGKDEMCKKFTSEELLELYNKKVFLLQKKHK